MRESYSEERRKRIGNLNKGKSLNAETRMLLSEAAKNRQPMRAETRLKCAVHVRPIVVTDLKGNNPQVFSSLISAANKLGCNEKTIRRSLKSNTGKLLRKYLVSDSVDT